MVRGETIFTHLRLDSLNRPETQLPPNKNFGYFFGILFIVSWGYFYYGDHLLVSYVSAVLATFFLLSAVIRPQLLSRPNQAWMHLGVLLGKIVSPIVLGSIFFLIFTPTAIVMRVFGRDELRLKTRTSVSFWRKPDPEQVAQSSFKNQF